MNSSSWIDAVSNWSGKLVAFLIPTLAGVEVYEVVARYGFGRPTIWAHELSSMLFGTFILIGGAYTLLHHGHMNMDIVYNRLPLRGRALLDVLTFFLFLAFVGVLLWKGWESAWRSIRLLEHDSTEWAPPLYPFKLILPLSALLLLLQGLAKFINNFRILITGRK